MVSEDIAWLEDFALKHRGAKLTCVVCAESARIIQGQEQSERRYFISSLPANPEQILHAVCAH